MGLLLTTDSEDKFVREALDLWLQIHEGDHLPKTEGHRADLANIKRKLAGKYTKVEKEALGVAALGLLD
jgi:hypothetical protein